MQINDFTNQYLLHDSLIEEIHYNSKNQTLTLKVDFCYWMQDNYTDEQPETGVIYLTFYNVPEYDNISGIIDSYSVLDFMFDSGVVIINLLDDYHNDYYELRFISDNVAVTHEAK